MHDEFDAVREPPSLSLNARAHLSHVLRNGLVLIRASIKEHNEEVIRLERLIEEMGL